MFQKRIYSAPSHVTQAAPVRSALLNHTALSALVQLLGCNLTTTLPQFRNGASITWENHKPFFPSGTAVRRLLLTPSSSKPEARKFSFFLVRPGFAADFEEM